MTWASTALSWFTLGMAIPYHFTENKDTIAIGVTWCTLCYYIADTIRCILNRDTPYIIHHSCALYVLYHIIAGHVNLHDVSYYFLTFELSNSFFYLWKRHRSHTIFPIFAMTYIPCRVVFLPVATYPLIRESHDVMLSCVYMSLLIMSYVYSYTIFKKALKHPVFQNYTVDVLTYMVKLYLTLYTFMAHVPHSPHRLALSICHCVDILHIFASWMYYITDTSLTFQRCDIIAIHAKIASLGVCNYLMYGEHEWVPVLSGALISGLIICIQSIDIREQKLLHMCLYSIHAVPVLYTSTYCGQWVHIPFYIFGAFAWYLFTYIGCMHTGIIIGDLIYVAKILDLS